MDIRKLLDIISENSKPKSAQKSLLKGVQVMSLPQFVAQQTSEEPLDEDDPQRFLGATYRKPSDDEMKGYLGRIVDKK